MCDKLLCYDEQLSTFFEIDDRDLNKLINSMNDRLSSSIGLSLDDVMDVINEFLPEDKKMTSYQSWFDDDLRGIQKYDHDFTYEYKAVFTLAKGDRLTAYLSFGPEEQ